MYILIFLDISSPNLGFVLVSLEFDCIGNTMIMHSGNNVRIICKILQQCTMLFQEFVFVWLSLLSFVRISRLNCICHVREWIVKEN